MGILFDSSGQSYNQLTETEQFVFEKLDINPFLIIEQDISSVAFSLDVSNTTLIRMAKKLGFSGWSEFKFFFKPKINQLVSNETNKNELQTHYLNTATNLIANLDINTYIKIAKKIYQSQRIIVVSVGMSKPLGEYTSKKLTQFNKDSSYVYESQIIDLFPRSLNKNDFVIFISMSGETFDIVSAAKKISHIHQNSLAITNESNSQLAQNAHFVLSSQVNSRKYLGNDMSPRYITLLQIDFLFDVYFQLFF